MKDRRVFRTAEIGSGHCLVISKRKILAGWKKNRSNNNNNEIVFRVHLLQEYNIRNLYQKRFEDYLAEKNRR